MRAVAILLRAIRAASPAGGVSISCLSADASLPLLTLLEPNLASESGLLRLSTARVLACYDPFRYDNGTSRAGGWVPGEQQHQEGLCEFLEVVEALETLPISLAAERDIMWRLGQLEVMGRSDRLPRPYVRLMATHALGLLRVKFSGVWPRARAILAALCQRPRQRELVWGPVHNALRNVMPPPATRHQPSKTASVAAETADEGKVATIAENGTSCTTARGSGLDRDLSEGGEERTVDVKGADTAQSASRQSTAAVPAREHQSGLRKTVPPPQPWVPRLLSHAAALDAGPTEEMDLPVALLGIFLDECARTGLQPESGQVSLWATTDADSAFAQVRGPSRTGQAQGRRSGRHPS